MFGTDAGVGVDASALLKLEEFEEKELEGGAIVW